MTVRVLWLRPPTPEGTSPGRHAIASVLRERGYTVVVHDARPVDNPHWDLAKISDVIIGTTHSGALEAYRLARATDTPLLVDHVDPLAQLRRTDSPLWARGAAWAIDVAAFRAADHVLYVASEDRGRIERWADASTATTLGVFADRFAPQDAPRPHDLENKVAVYAGTLNRQYHVRELLAAVGGLRDWSLAVIGDGPAASVVRDAARERQDVAYGGARAHDQVPYWLWTADVGLCMVEDARTVKALEYGAAELPVVHYDCLAARERYGDAVMYADPTPASIATAIADAHVAGSSQALASLAREHDYANVADDYEAAIVDAVGERPDIDGGIGCVEAWAAMGEKRGRE